MTDTAAEVTPNQQRLLLALWARIEAALRIADTALHADVSDVLEPDKLSRNLKILSPYDELDLDWTGQSDSFPGFSTSDVFIRWRNVFAEETEVVRRARNSVAHALSVSPADILAAIGIAARLIAYLLIGLGHPNLDSDPALAQAFTISGTPIPRPSSS